MLTLLSFIVVLGVLIFVHELGHFIFAKLFGVGVEKFSLGFGPKLFGKKLGETEYLISSFPLGGYVKMVGENDDGEISPEDEGRSFAGKTPLQRIAIVAAGPLFNLFFAYLIFIIVFMLGVPSDTPKIGEVMAGKPAAQAGLQAGDLVTAINGKQIKHWEELSQMVQESKGKPLDIRVLRNKAELTFRVVPEYMAGKNRFGEQVRSPVIGVKSSKDTVVERYGPVEAVIKGSAYTWNVVKLTLLSIIKIFQGAISRDSVGGPIMIAVSAGEYASAGLTSFLAFMALLSVNLGILNLLPVPVLDGGHLFFNLWELCLRRPIRAEIREFLQKVGLFLLLSLMVFAFYNDIVRYWDKIVKYLNGIVGYFIGHT
ncbi:MAG TPA: RIP metalloprotease RseP [Geobacteraceae bacterium]|nr:RIP metalloprotease RseP [Geobacteraceae bacterium]